MRAVDHGEPHVGKVKRGRVLSGVIADRDLNSLSQKLSKTVAGQLIIVFFDVFIACFDALLNLAGDRDLISGLDLAFTLKGLDLSHDSSVLLGHMRVVYCTLTFESVGVSICAQLLGAQETDLEETIVSKCHDEPIL